MKRALPIALLALAPLLGGSVARADEDRPAPKAAEEGPRDRAPMVLVPAGPFRVGDPASPGAALGEATLPAYLVDRHEVTNAQYRDFLAWVKVHGDASVRHADQPAGKDHTPRYAKPFRPALLAQTGIAPLQPFDDDTFRKDDHPVVGVDWWDAYAYARWAGKRLPTDAEWEKAARGTDGRLWPWGSAWDFRRCNSGGYEHRGEKDGWIYAAPAESYPTGVSPYGCHDMAGNVAEWASSDDPSAKPVRGGGSSSYPSQVRAAARATFEPGFRTFTIGFRCAKDVPAEAPTR